MSVDMSFMRFVLIFSSNSGGKKVPLPNCLFFKSVCRERCGGDCSCKETGCVYVSKCVSAWFSHSTCCTGVYFTVCVLSWLLMISKSLTASPLAGPLKLQSRLAFPAPLVLTVKWVGLFNSTPEREREQQMSPHKSGLQFSYNSTQIQNV